MVFGSANARPISLWLATDAENKQHTEISVFIEESLKSKNAVIHSFSDSKLRALESSSRIIGIALGAQNCHLMSTRLASGRLLCMDLHYSQIQSLQIGPHPESLQIVGIPLDAPPALLVKAVRQFLPKARIGVLLGPDSSVLLKHLKQLAPNEQPEFRLVRFEDSPLSAFRTIAKRNDLIIAFYDHYLYASENLESLFLSSFRLDVPVVGFSEKLTQAGALFSLHSSLLEQKQLLARGSSLLA